MPEARDRIARTEDVADAYLRRRRSSIGPVNGHSTRPIEVLTDDGQSTAPVTPFRWGATGMTTPGTMGVAAAGDSGGGGRTGGFRTPRLPGRNAFGSVIYNDRTASAVVRNGGGRGRGRGRGVGRGSRGGSVLPAWYPRTPLRDVTAIVRAIERRRARLREDEGQQNEGPAPQDQSVHDSSAGLGAQLEPQISTPVGKKPCVSSASRVSKILLDVTNQSSEDSRFLTPQKKLLNSIETVEKVVMEELAKIKRTPAARKAEQRQRVRTLMSMR